ncbi:MAG: hypothetical protein AAGC81_19875 [Pseudomonadota bacterium]
MNQISAFELQESGIEPDSAPATMPPMQYKIMRTGQRPLVFDGIELCMAMNFIPGAPYWFEINIYRTASQHFVAAVKTFFSDENARDRAKAWEFETFDEVVEALEAYDAASDMRVDSFADETDLSALELAALGYSLMAKAKAARDQYSGLMGEILHEVDA